MDRRTWLMGSLGLLAAPLAPAAQPQRVYRIGWLGGTPSTSRSGRGLRALGYVEGQNLVIEARFHQGKPDRPPRLAAELVALRVDLIVCATTAATKAADARPAPVDRHLPPHRRHRGRALPAVRARSPGPAG